MRQWASACRGQSLQRLLIKSRNIRSRSGRCGALGRFDHQPGPLLQEVNQLAIDLGNSCVRNGLVSRRRSGPAFWAGGFPRFRARFRHPNTQVESNVANLSLLPERQRRVNPVAGFQRAAPFRGAVRGPYYAKMAVGSARAILSHRSPHLESYVKYCATISYGIGVLVVCPAARPLLPHDILAQGANALTCPKKEQ
jgi:hypothetical protein